MYQVKINSKEDYNIQISDDEVLINNQNIIWDLQPLPNGSFSVIANGKSYVAIIDNIDKQNKLITLRINDHSYEATITEPMDLLLKKMGINIVADKKAEPIKAMMPGLVLKILVTEGQAIKKGEPVLILEAMKMENVFKAAADATVKNIKVTEGKAVEKGEVLIELA